MQKTIPQKGSYMKNIGRFAIKTVAQIQH